MRLRYRRYLHTLLFLIPIILLVKVILHYNNLSPGPFETLSRRNPHIIGRDFEVIKPKDKQNRFQWRQTETSGWGVRNDERNRWGKMKKKVFDIKDRHSPDRYGTCDDRKCNPTKEGMLNVHIVVHSHDDVGWKKTYMQYYNGKYPSSGESNYFGNECTQCILTSVIPELLKDSKRRFIFVEMAFFSLWFSAQNEEMKKSVRQLIRERRLELIIGGWCMSDSATTYYDDVIDQHTHGFQWIETELGECAMPKSAWHLDQFGHSREHSSIFAQMGYDGLIIGRIDNKDQDRRMTTRNMETIWKTSPDNLGEGTELFTSVLYDGYFSPHEVSGSRINDASKEHIVDTFLTMVKERASVYKTNHLLIPYGGDFALSHAHSDYGGLDNLIKYTNELQKQGSKVNVLYSTPTCYINSVNKEGKAFETMTTDFFPYGITPNTYWTGFFTSRPGLKRHVKVASTLLQTCKMITVMADLPGGYKKVAPLKEAVAVLQHHDAITGTEQQHVSNDYNKILSAGETSCQSVLDSAYRMLLKVEKTVPEQVFCPNLNISSCNFTENHAKFSVVVFNPLGWEVSSWIRLPVRAGQFVVTSPHGDELIHQISPLPVSTSRIPERGLSKSNSELVFKILLPPVGFSVYFVRKMSESKIPKMTEHQGGDNIVISNQHLSLTVDSSSGLTTKLKNLDTDVTVDFEQTFLYYLGSKGGRRIYGDTRGGMGGFFGGHKRASGAYAFVPKENTPPVPIRNKDQKVTVKMMKGDNVQEIHQEFSPWVSQVIRLYSGAHYLEMEWTVGPVPDQDRETKEVISRYQTDMDTDKTWYTDSNGREMVQRKFNFREPFSYNVTCPISGNYHPVTARMYIKDENRKSQLTILTDRSQAGGSLNNGQMEFLVHRRTFFDDDLGVEEPLNELGVDQKGLIIRGKHYILLNTIEQAPSDYRPLGLQIHRFPTVSFMSGMEEKEMRMKGSWLKKGFPNNVHLLTLDQTPGTPHVLLIRLENYFEKREYAESVSVNLDDHIRDIQAMRELSLGANHNITDVNRLVWKNLEEQQTPRHIGSEATRQPLRSPFTISLKPMEIRTFFIYLTAR